MNSNSNSTTTNNNRLSISLVSDLSFGGRVAPGWSGGVSKERGAISGQLATARGSKNFDLSGNICCN